MGVPSRMREILTEKILEQRIGRVSPCRNKPKSGTGRRDSTCKGPEAALCLLGARKAQGGQWTCYPVSAGPVEIWPGFWGWLCRPLRKLTAE